MSAHPECPLCGSELIAGDDTIVEPRVVYVVGYMDPNSSERGPFWTGIVDMPQDLASEDNAIELVKASFEKDDDEAIRNGVLTEEDRFDLRGDEDLFWYAHEMPPGGFISPEGL